MLGYGGGIGEGDGGGVSGGSVMVVVMVRVAKLVVVVAVVEDPVKGQVRSWSGIWCWRRCRLRRWVQGRCRVWNWQRVRGLVSQGCRRGSKTPVGSPAPLGFSYTDLFLILLIS